MKIMTCMTNRIVMFIFAVLPLFASSQDSAEVQPAAPTTEFVRATFENPVLINNQTTELNGHKSLDFIIQHRFGLVKNSDDLFGLYAPSNIRFGISYGLLKNVTLGAGVTKNKMMYDFNGKVALLKQTKGKGSPVSISYFGNFTMSDQDADNFLNQDGEYKKVNKMNYFNEIMVARKINSKLSLQIAGTYSYFNIIDSAYSEHAFYGVSFAGRYKFSPQSSVMVDYDFLLNTSDIEEAVKPEPNLSIGYEVSTGSHQFQVFVTTAQGIVSQEYRLYNTNDFFSGDVVLGFNITRQWGFKK